MFAGGEKSRTDTRQTVMLRAKVIDSRGSRTAQISDVSERGLLGVMEQPPARGEFISVHFPSCELGGQVRWVNGRRFGVRLREQVDAAALMGTRRTAGTSVGSRVAAQEAELAGKKLVMAYAVLLLTALSTAYLIVTYLV